MGFAGTGKLTIAKELQQQMPVLLVDNHLILNVVFSLIDVDGVTTLPKAVWNNARKIRDMALDTVRHRARPERMKATDAVTAQRRASQSELLRPAGHDYFDLDVTTLPAIESARRIVMELERRRHHS